MDALCHNFYGHLGGTVEAVLNANQGLADEPQPFRAGLLIKLPDLVAETEDVIQLWD